MNKKTSNQIKALQSANRNLRMILANTEQNVTNLSRLSSRRQGMIIAATEIITSQQALIEKLYLAYMGVDDFGDSITEEDHDMIMAILEIGADGHSDGKWPESGQDDRDNNVPF